MVECQDKYDWQSLSMPCLPICRPFSFSWCFHASVSDLQYRMLCVTWGRAPSRRCCQGSHGRKGAREGPRVSASHGG